MLFTLNVQNYSLILFILTITILFYLFSPYVHSITLHNFISPGSCHSYFLKPSHQLSTYDLLLFYFFSFLLFSFYCMYRRLYNNPLIHVNRQEVGYLFFFFSQIAMAMHKAGPIILGASSQILIWGL
jgi:hypothetical protein